MSQQAIGRILLMPKGDYNASTTYNMLDWCRYNGKAWVCKQDNTVGVAPSESTVWTMLVQDGSGGTGSGDMQKTVYDTDDNGVVDAAETLSGLTIAVSQLNLLSGATSNIQNQLDGKVADNPTFSKNTANPRPNVASGDSISTLFGKVMRWFDDLKDLAFIAKPTSSPTTKYLRGDGSWQTFPTVPDELKELTGDVSIAGSVTNGHVLTYDSTASKWTPQAPASGGHTMTPTPSSSVNETAVVNAINTAITEGGVNDDVVSAYGVGKWANVTEITYLVHGTSSSSPIHNTGVGTWDDTFASESDWLYIADLVGILSDPTKHVEVVFDPDYFADDIPVFGGWLIDDTTGKICIKFANEISNADCETGVVGVKITTDRTAVSWINGAPT